jgi:hypothetical protein
MQPFSATDPPMNGSRELVVEIEARPDLLGSERAGLATERARNSA